MADLIMNTKNEKIFQESILLAIRLLDGGNTEIQVLSPSCAVGASPGGIGQPRFDVCSVTVPAHGRRGCRAILHPGLAPGFAKILFGGMCLLAVQRRDCRNLSGFVFSNWVDGAGGLDAGEETGCCRLFLE